MLFRSSAFSLINSLFFDPKRYDISKVRRYKYNKKLGLANRLEEVIVAEDVIDPNTGEILVEAGNANLDGQFLTREQAALVENSGVHSVLVYEKDSTEVVTKVIGNNFVDLEEYVAFDTSQLKVSGKVYYPVLRQILADFQDEDELKEEINRRKNNQSKKT